MYFPDRGVYTPYSPCMSTPLSSAVTTEEQQTRRWTEDEDVEPSGSHEEAREDDAATTTVKSGRLATATEDDFDFTTGARGGTRSSVAAQHKILTTN